jgi:hypothetical protein
MFAVPHRVLVRLGRWPRRIAAATCLLLAAGTALVPHTPATSPAGPRLGAGEVAVPVTVTLSAAAAPGSRIGLLAAPAGPSGLPGERAGAATLVADRLRVLTVAAADTGLTGSGGTLVTVAASRAIALQLARYADRTLVMIADDLP